MAPDPPGFFLPPVTIPPLVQPHKQTFILLHGRGFHPTPFWTDLFSMPIPAPAPDTRNTTYVLSSCLNSSQQSSLQAQPTELAASAAAATAARVATFREIYPHAKFVLPAAPSHRATIYKRKVIPQWFDSWHLAPVTLTTKEHIGEEPEEWRTIPGLRATVLHIHALIREEAALLEHGAQDVVIGGFSQGCAAALMALMLWDGAEKLGGFWGMGGWLPFAGLVQSEVRAAEEHSVEADQFDPFERNDFCVGDIGDRGDAVIGARVVRALQERLEIDCYTSASTTLPRISDTPVFLGHGDQDDNVPISLSRQAAECLQAAGFAVIERHEYHGLEHWYSPSMLTDVVKFLRKHWEGNMNK